MNENAAKLFLLDQIPTAKQSAVAAALRRGYDSAAASITADPNLRVQSAVDGRGRIISWAVDRALELLIEGGQWDVEFRWRPFAKPTGKYLEVRTGYAVMMVSQVADATEQPRDVGFRANLRLSPQPMLPYAEFADERIVTGLPHILLVHGYKHLDFAHLGLPHPRHAEGYIYRTSNIMALPRAVDTPHPPAEDTDYEAVISLKEEIDKWRRDNGAG